MIRGEPAIGYELSRANHACIRLIELAGLDLGEVEHLVDEAEKMGTRTIISVSPMMALSGVGSQR
jgi:hypothetical protein